MGPPIPAGLRAAAIGSRSGGEQVAPAQRQGQFQQLVGDYTNPILKPQAAEVVTKHGEISLAGVGYPIPSNQCWPGGVPFIFWDPGMQMLQRPDKITNLYSRYDFRQVRMNQPHRAPVTRAITRATCW
jgi:hypothetical protein